MLLARDCWNEISFSCPYPSSFRCHCVLPARDCWNATLPSCVGERSVRAFHGSTPVHTQESSRYFLPRNSAWPSPAVTMSSSLVGDPPRDGSRVLYVSRSPGSGESPLVYSEFMSDFLSRWLTACKRTSSVLVGESHDLPGVGGVVNRGRIAVSTRNTWCPDTVGIFCVKWLVSRLRRTATRSST